MNIQHTKDNPLYPSSVDQYANEWYMPTETGAHVPSMRRTGQRDNEDMRSPDRRLNSPRADHGRTRRTDDFSQ